MADAPSTAPEKPSVDSILTKLERVVRELEQGDLSLEDSLARFEQGIALSRQGQSMLAAMDARVEQLLESGETAPMSSPGESA